MTFVATVTGLSDAFPHRTVVRLDRRSGTCRIRLRARTGDRSRLASRAAVVKAMIGAAWEDAVRGGDLACSPAWCACPDLLLRLLLSSRLPRRRGTALHQRHHAARAGRRQCSRWRQRSSASGRTARTRSVDRAVAMPELRARQLTKRFSGIASSRTSTSASARRHRRLPRPNGSGKTTTARMLAGLLEPSSGRVEYDGRDIHLDPIAFRRGSATSRKKRSCIPSSPDANTSS